MPTADALLSAIVQLRRRLRASEDVFILVAVLVGLVAGTTTVILAAIARMMQHWLFGLPTAVRLSGIEALSVRQLLILPAGGLALALLTHLVRARGRPLVDAVEANALHGGRMSMSDSAIIASQTLVSNGFGASVGLEAAYAQIGGAVASFAGRRLNLRRADLRTLVGAGAGAAIAAAFGAPLAGAFYAFEIVIGAYTPAAIAPVVAAALAGAVAARTLDSPPYIVAISSGAAIHTADYIIYAGLGAVCAVIAIVLMRAVAFAERASRMLPLPAWARPLVGGCLLVPIAIISPQALSAGHAALKLDLAVGVSLGFIALVLAAKCLASVISLGFGFRGGLFFASLFVGTLVGHLFAGGLALATGSQIVDPGSAALVGMAALAVAVVGGPMTMALLVLEATHDFALTGAVLAASLVASTIVRERFGYSFSTWRLHLRGETIKSARDVGWIRTLTAERMMRRDTRATDAAVTVAEFRHRFPLGSTSRVVIVDAERRYVGIVSPAAAFADGADVGAAIGSIAGTGTATLPPTADIRAIMAMFDHAQSDELAVVDADHRVLGILSEAFVRRRYTEELEKAQRDLFREP